MCVGSRNELSRMAMDGCMASGAECYQVFFGVVAGLTAKLPVMDL